MARATASIEEYESTALLETPAMKMPNLTVRVVLQITVPLKVPKMIRHSCRKDPKKDPNLENPP